MLSILTQWQWEPWLLACVIAAAVPYAMGMRRMGAQRGAILGRWRAVSFLVGLFVLLLALLSPLDAVADDLFSAHMFQHMLLLLVIPPLLVYGRPVMAWLWAFELNGRRALVRGWKRARLDTTFRMLMHPLVVWVLLTAALCFWHLPGPYDAAVRSEWLHDLEHLSFLVVSLQFWTLVIEPYGQRRALGYGATVVFVVSAGFVMGMIGAVLTFAPAALYGAYLHTTKTWGLTPLDDQQLAGIIMWIPSNLVHAGTLCTVFFAWFRADERRATLGFRRVPHALPMLLVAVPLLALMLSGCAGGDAQGRAQHAAVRRGAQLISAYGCGSRASALE